MKLLESNNAIIAENAALVLANSTHESDKICIEFIKHKNCFGLLLDQLYSTF